MFRGSDLGLLILVWAIAGSRLTRAAAPRRPVPTAPRRPAPTAPRRPAPPTLSPPEEMRLTADDLLNPPDPPGYRDRRWAMYVGHPQRPGPPIEDDNSPVTRKLNDFERWALAPYFPVLSDLDATIHNGKKPPDVASDPVLHAVTTPDGEIWFPTRAPLYALWWLSVLGHELTHRAQLRLGMTDEQGRAARERYGYLANPIEIQARWMQARILRGLYERANAFLERNP